MADKKIPADELPGVSSDAPDTDRASRRDFVRRAALVGLPVVLASVSSRTVWARSSQQISGLASCMNGSCESAPNG